MGSLRHSWVIEHINICNTRSQVRHPSESRALGVVEGDRPREVRDVEPERKPTADVNFRSWNVPPAGALSAVKSSEQICVMAVRTVNRILPAQKAQELSALLCIVQHSGLIFTNCSYRMKGRI
jgi:hypothetical protein